VAGWAVLLRGQHPRQRSSAALPFELMISGNGYYQFRTKPLPPPNVAKKRGRGVSLCLSFFLISQSKSNPWV